MPFQKRMCIKKLIEISDILIGGGNLRKAQCVYCGKIVYVDRSYGIGSDKIYEENHSYGKEVSRFERCTGHRDTSGELGLHKYNMI